MTSRRSDFRRNRAMILRVAAWAFAQGSEVMPIPEIARRAGLGRATVYRHFPDLRSLGTAVAERNIELLGWFVDHADDAGFAFRDVLRTVLSARWTLAPLVSLFRALPEEDQRRHLDQVISVLTPAFRREQEAGRLRPDVSPADIAVMFAMVEAGINSGPEISQTTADRRMVEWIIDGIFITAEQEKPIDRK